MNRSGALQTFVVAAVSTLLAGVLGRLFAEAIAKARSSAGISLDAGYRRQTIG